MTITQQRESVFSEFAAQAWPYSYRVELLINEIHGGTPRDPDKLRSWLIAKAGMTDEREIEDELVRIFSTQLAQMTMDEVVAPDINIKVQDMEEAIKARKDRHVNGFKRDERGLYIEGRHLKACLKEAVSVARAADKLPAKFGVTGKGTIAFAAEHIFVPENKIYLSRKEHDELHTRFTKTRFGTGITVEEVCRDVIVTATVKSDWPFTEKEWAMIWLTAEAQGIGSSRSQGFGRFVVTEWSPLTANGRKKRSTKVAA